MNVQNKRRIFKTVMGFGFLFYGLAAYAAPNSGTPALAHAFTNGLLNGTLIGVLFVAGGLAVLITPYSIITLWLSSIPMILYVFIVAIQTFALLPNISLTPIAGLLMICGLIWAYVYENLGD